MSWVSEQRNNTKDVEGSSSFFHVWSLLLQLLLRHLPDPLPAGKAQQVSRILHQLCQHHAANAEDLETFPAIWTCNPCLLDCPHQDKRLLPPPSGCCLWILCRNWVAGITISVAGIFNKPTAFWKSVTEKLRNRETIEAPQIEKNDVYNLEDDYYDEHETRIEDMNEYYE